MKANAKTLDENIHQRPRHSHYFSHCERFRELIKYILSRAVCKVYAQKSCAEKQLSFAKILNSTLFCTGINHRILYIVTSKEILRKKIVFRHRISANDLCAETLQTARDNIHNRCFRFNYILLLEPCFHTTEWGGRGRGVRAKEKYQEIKNMSTQSI